MRTKEKRGCRTTKGGACREVTCRVRANNDWKPASTKELFEGKAVVVFSLPGALTRTCSSTLLPRYSELVPAFFANGADSILCVPAGADVHRFLTP